MSLKKKVIDKWNFLCSTDGSLKKKVVRSSAWAFLLRVVLRSITFLRTIILARFLAPNDFGLFGISLLTLSILETFSQTGFQQALIQKRTNTRKYLDSAWTVSILRGIFLYAILYFVAPYAAKFFNYSDASFFIRIIGLSLLFRSFTNIGVIYFRKELEFRKEFLYQFSGAMVDFTFTIIVFIFTRSVWALVVGILAGDITRLVGGYLIHPYRPKIDLDIKKIKKLFGFGKWVTSSTILTFLLNEGDDVLVGRVLGVTTLGLYQIAYKISNLPVTEITLALFPIVFPAYSKLQNNLEKLRKAYIKVLQLTAFLAFPITGLTIVLSHDFTSIFLGNKWLPMVPTLQILALVGLLTSLGSTAGPVFYSLNKPKIITNLQIIQLIILSILIIPFTFKWGLVGTTSSLLIATFLTSVIEVRRIVKIMELKVINVINPLILPLFNTLVTTLFVVTIKNYSAVSLGAFGFLLLSLSALFIHLTTALVLSKISNYPGLSTIKEAVSLLARSE